MSFRFEQKVLFHFSDYLKIKNFIFNSGGSELYPKRKINSLYFDNFNNEMYLHSEDGCLPRKKIRIRNYPNSKNSNLLLEKKISSVEGRYKNTKKINKFDYHNLIERGFFDSSYGTCYPKIWVTYHREYFLLSNNRITLDKEIEYKCYRSSRYIKDYESIILEVKSNNVFDVNIFDKAVPFQKLRMSKYCDGFNKLFNKNENQRLNQVI